MRTVAVVVVLDAREHLATEWVRQRTRRAWVSSTLRVGQEMGVADPSAERQPRFARQMLSTIQTLLQKASR